MFGYNVNRNVIYILLAILIIMSISNMKASDLMSLLLTLPAVVMAISFHEFAHANAADKLGDTTPRNQGRLTLNPIAHLDLTGFILMMFANIGWGKPVQVNPRNFTSNKSMGFCETMVSLAGPLMNFFLAFIFTIIIASIKTFATSFVATTIGSYLIIFSMIAVQVNIGLGVFNLIPLPPLDGEKIFRNVLPYKAQQWLMENYQTLYMVFILLWIFGVLGELVSPVINFLSNLLYSVVFKMFSFF